MKPARSFAVPWFAIAACCGAAEIHLRPQCQCETPLVTLADVAEIFPADDPQADQLAATELFPAPPAGRSRLCKAREIHDVLTQRGVDFKQHRLCGASAVAIIGSDAGPNDAKRPDAPVKRAVHWVSSSASPSNAHTAITKEPSADPASPAGSMVVAAWPLARGQIIGDADVRLEPAEAQLAGAKSLGLEQVIGFELLRAVPAGQPLAAGDLRPQRLVQRGEIVTVFARTRGVQVRTTAKAIDEGALGDVVSLESLLTKDARFTARVTGRKEVEIIAGAPRIDSAAEPSPQPGARPARRGSIFELRVGNVPSCCQE